MYFRNNEKKREPLKRFEATRVIVIGFALMIAAGAALLAAPISGSGHRSIGIFDALYTATSAVCVTGLSVIDVSADLSRFGQVVLMALIQLGGLGFMAFGMGLLLALGRKITLRERMLIRESMNFDKLNGTISLMRWVLGATLCVELLGAALFAIRLVPRMGWGDGLFYAAFHAVSAFCNAGFDLFGDSLLSFSGDWLVLGDCMLLIVCGGLGFAVLLDLIGRHPSTANTKIVVVVTGILLLIGFLLTLGLEWNGAFAGLAWYDKLLNAMFESVTLRTAGFASVSQGSLRPITRFIACAFMFIGAAPASTGGGVKVTTFAVVVLLVCTAARGREEPVLWKKRIDKNLLLRATVIFLISILVLLAAAALLIALEPGFSPLDLLFEAASAFGTVGLSCDLTPQLGTAARVVEILVMFLGRVGPLTLTLAVASRQSSRTDSVTYPPAKIVVG